MYTIHVDSRRALLQVELSGRLTTGEALRALSQAMALAEATPVRGALVDLSEVDRGPGGLLMLAAVFSARYRPPLRVAFVGRPAQAPLVVRFINFTGRQLNLGFFGPADQPEEWVLEAPALPGRPPRKRLSGTAERHARTLLGANGAGQSGTDHSSQLPAA